MHPIHQLIHYGLHHSLITPLDTDYVFNRSCQILGIDDLSPYNPHHQEKVQPLDDILTPLLDHAVEVGKISPDTTTQRDLFEALIMDLLTPRPTEMKERFYRLYHENPQAATDDFYRLSQNTNYIKTKRIAKNEAYTVDSKYGKIGITINLSKPEKDPKDIANMTKSQDYPSCLLCKEYVGYYGNAQQPARTNHRVIPITLNNEPFYFQYSPYVYYNEHAIVLHEQHIPMDVKKHTFIRLLDFIEMFPHYFMGSNAGLPIVGGSILHHEHYQGGRAEFPIEKAKVLKTYNKESVEYQLLYWPLSTIRLISRDKNALIEAAENLRIAWESYQNEDLAIISKTSKAHNAITPIARKKDDAYIIDIALRNNRTNDDYPDGIFHPHPDKHHIKKENIGLIEVMGLAILPGRLKKDFQEIKSVLNTNKKVPEHLIIYKDWIESLKHKELSNYDESSIKHQAGEVFIKGLEDCGVFKQTPEGQKAFEQFIERLVNED